MNKAKVIEELKVKVNAQISEARKAIDEIQESINQESRSTAGDKHDTSRELLQQERNKAAQNLSELLKMREVFSKLEQIGERKEIGFGSLLETEMGWVFIGLPLGKVKLSDGEELICISAVSPLARKLMGSV